MKASADGAELAAIREAVIERGERLYRELWGDPKRLPDELPQVFDEPEIEHWFPMHPASIKVGTFSSFTA